MKSLPSALGALGALLLAGSALASTGQDAAPAGADAAVIEQQLPSYPLTTCPISGHELGEDAVNHVQDGRLVRLCCEDCVAGVEKDPKAVVAKIDAAVIAAQGPSYPLTTCVVSGEELGGMGEPIDYVHGTRLVRFCCKMCVKGFTKDPKPAMAKVDAALIAAQLETYPLTTCVISGNPIGDDGVDHLYGTRLVRFCCADCVAGFLKAPAKHLAKLDAAAAKAPTKG